MLLATPALAWAAPTQPPSEPPTEPPRKVVNGPYDPAARRLVHRRGGAASDSGGGDPGLPSGVDPAVAGPFRAENAWGY